MNKIVLRFIIIICPSRQCSYGYALNEFLTDSNPKYILKVSLLFAVAAAVVRGSLSMSWEQYVCVCRTVRFVMRPRSSWSAQVVYVMCAIHAYLWVTLYRQALSILALGISTHRKKNKRQPKKQLLHHRPMFFVCVLCVIFNALWMRIIYAWFVDCLLSKLRRLSPAERHIIQSKRTPHS